MPSHFRQDLSDLCVTFANFNHRYSLKVLSIATILLSSCATGGKDLSSEPYYRDLIGKKICIKHHMLVAEWADEATGRFLKEIFRLEVMREKVSFGSFSDYRLNHKNTAEFNNSINNVTPVPAGTLFTVNQITYHGGIAPIYYTINSTTNYPGLYEKPVEITYMFNNLSDIEANTDLLDSSKAEFC